jgi:hypothetical protein
MHVHPQLMSQCNTIIKKIIIFFSHILENRIDTKEILKKKLLLKNTYRY